MFSFLSPYKLAIQIGAVVLAIVAMCAFYGTFKTKQQQIGYDRAAAEYTKKALEAEKIVRLKEQEYHDQVEKARDEAAIQDARIATLNKSTVDTVAGLRNTITTLRSKVASNSQEANRVTADTALALFGECTKRYRDVAEAADKHARDVKMLQDAWPTQD